MERKKVKGQRDRAQAEQVQIDGNRIEGRNPVLEAFRAGKTIDRLFVQEHLSDGPIQTILREAKKTDTIVQFLPKERLDQTS